MNEKEFKLELKRQNDEIIKLKKVISILEQSVKKITLSVKRTDEKIRQIKSDVSNISHSRT